MPHNLPAKPLPLRHTARSAMAVQAHIAEPIPAAKTDAGRPVHFANPIVAAAHPAGSADPSVVHAHGHYYYCRSIGDRGLGIARAERLQDIGRAEMVMVWEPRAGTPWSSEIWAPELQYVRGNWYIYFAASDGDNRNHRMYVLEAKTDDPQGEYTFKGRIAAATDRWAIDGIAVEHDDGLYFVWSGWRDEDAGFPQVLYIAAMSDPCTISGDRHEIAAPGHDWECVGAPLLEGPAVLYRGGSLFISYSASASWTDHYTLGLLRHTGGDILAASSWTKTATPVFAAQPLDGVFGPGHNSFVKSPDGGEDWIVYHAIDQSGGGWSQRSVRAQRFDWTADGQPVFGKPVAAGVAVEEPAGTVARVPRQALHRRRAAVRHEGAARSSALPPNGGAAA